MSSYGVSVSNALRIQEDSIKEIAVYVVSNLKCLSTVEKEWDIQVLLIAFPPKFQKLGNELLEFVTHLFVPNKIKAYRGVSI